MQFEMKVGDALIANFAGDWFDYRRTGGGHCISSSPRRRVIRCRDKSVSAAWVREALTAALQAASGNRVKVYEVSQGKPVLLLDKEVEFIWADYGKHFNLRAALN
ncbi:hypothetical protein [Pyruvatibacter mobilis]|uniref:hypothetical protein n=1 Tax=Pyruvatibacter mobilis TaxID=1712261 RepID=UPI003D0D8753